MPQCTNHVCLPATLEGDLRQSLDNFCLCPGSNILRAPDHMFQAFYIATPASDKTVTGLLPHVYRVQAPTVMHTLHESPCRHKLLIMSAWAQRAAVNLKKKVARKAAPGNLQTLPGSLLYTRGCRRCQT